MFAAHFIRGLGARSLIRALLAFALVFTPAAATGLLPQAAQAQGAIDFHAALDGYGHWVQHPRWGEVWVPDQTPPDWQPYRLGHWVYTDEWGWYWDSEEDFGWVTYHYGRWVFDPGFGWIWIPGNDWGPAFVDWRQGDDFVGWAPLPPDDYIDDGYESPDIYMFVRAGDLLAPRAYAVFIPVRERFAYYNRSFLVNRSVRLRGGRIAVNPGVPPAFIARASGRPFHPVSIAPVVLAGTAGVAGAVVIRDNFRDRERTRIVVRETTKFIQPNDHFVRLKPLQKGERGQLGGSTPLAARGVGIEVKSKSFGGAPSGNTLQNQGGQKQFTPNVKNLGTSGNQSGQQKNFQEKTFQQQGGQQNNQLKTFQQQGGQKTIPGGSQTYQYHQQNLQQQQQQQQKTFQQQNFQQKSFQQGGQNNQPHVQQNVQPQVKQQNTQRGGGQQQNNSRGDKNKQQQ
ncbi:MAG TPA: DUF6600 domain-containing protein [Xanthobacteraceae bacterium]|nr:DUF6600 domain-containing protein [Xanthobacteraceae bacterium]